MDRIANCKQVRKSARYQGPASVKLRRESQSNHYAETSARLVSDLVHAWDRPLRAIRMALLHDL